MGELRASEGDFLETREGLIFDVKGLVHPPEKIVAFIRYVPDERGGRRRKGRNYRKIYSLDARERYLREKYPEYLSWDPVFNTWIQEVPLDRILLYYRPAEKLGELMSQETLDDAEKSAVDLARLICSEAGVPLNSVGVTGSILVGLHSESSDIDLVVRGERNCRRAYDTLKQLLSEAREVRRYTLEDYRRLYTFRSKDTLIPFEDFVTAEGRKTLQGIFRGRDFYVRLVKSFEEYGERYGDKIYVPLGEQEVRARVVDASDSIFTPCRYVVKVMDVIKGPKRFEVSEIASFRGRFCELALEGEEVVARGKLEKVVTREGTYYRLLLGSKRHHYMVPARSLA